MALNMKAKKELIKIFFFNRTYPVVILLKWNATKEKLFCVI